MTEAGDSEAHAHCVLSDGTTLTLAVRTRDGTPAPLLNAKALLALLEPCAEARLKDQAAPSEPSRARFGIVGRSPGVLALVRMIEKVAQSHASVLITGENGTGKELVARAIHQASQRRERAFVAVNCSAFNDNLLESEMFGHRRGAFTGAQADKRGLFEEADGGTMFLDEVGDMSPALQVKLLRVLQEGTFMPVGSTQQKRVDVRIVAATNRDLGSLVKQGKFREDLYYRLHVVALRVPSLRDRGEDLEELASVFLARLNARHGQQKVLHPDTLARIKAHSFPGNVRELQNELERIFVLSGDEPSIGPEHLSASLGRARPSLPEMPELCAATDRTENGEPLQSLLDRYEREVLMRSLKRLRGNRTKVAQVLGMSRRNLLRKLQQHGLGGEDDAATPSAPDETE
jgi:two-component system response regulator HupR/HoxA